MMRQRICLDRMSAVLLVLSAPTVAAAAEHAPSASLADYRRAGSVMKGEAPVLNNDLATSWLPDGEHLWYQRALDAGSEFVLVDVARRTRGPAFDHDRMAAALGAALGQPLTAGHLPIRSLAFDGTGITVTTADKRFVCDLAQPVCAPAPPAPDMGDALSPDRRHAVFVRDHNLWVRDVATGRERALTDDGGKDLEWGKLAIPMEITMARRGLRNPPSGAFSPDGRYFFTHRLDETKVPFFNMVQNLPEDGTFHPKAYSVREAFPGDPQPLAAMAIFDLTTGRRVTVDLPPQPYPYLSPELMGMLSWRSDGAKAYILTQSDDYRTLAMSEVDPTTGKVRRLIAERSSIFNLPSVTQFDRTLARPLANGDILWASDRSGYTHLYRYDGKTLRLKNVVTSGNWMVRQILHVDEVAGEIYFEAIGRQADPYLRQIYRVKLDGTGLTRLTPEAGDHRVALAGALRIPPSLGGPATPPERSGFSPDGKYFVDSYASPETPSVTVVRDRAGKSVMTLEQATPSTALKPFYRQAEMFSAIAADGKTPVYGTIFKPSTLDPTRSYPVIDNIYPGPQITRTSKRFSVGSEQALAELGFIVVVMDGRGTPLRSRDFLAAAYHDMQAAGHLDDHIAALKQLAVTRPYMDLDRVGVWGSSAGGFGTARAMFDYPDFFKVGVAAAGNHDQRVLSATWAPVYHGPFDANDSKAYLDITSFVNARNLKGKLLVVNGDMDDQVHPANATRLVDALIKSNKMFDMLTLPNVNHAVQTPYFTRRMWDYFVVNLQGGHPPADMSLSPAAP